MRCDNVWLAVAGLVVNEEGKWLVVKKKYGGLKGAWSLPAGFVKADETADEAVLREVKEKTGIDTEIIGLAGLRSGVLKGEISDNMLIFLLRPVSMVVTPQLEELSAAAFLSIEDILKTENRSRMLEELVNMDPGKVRAMKEGLNPGDQFGYTSYKLFF